MTPRSGPCPYSLGEEIAHSVTHGLGAVLSGAGLMALVGAALEDGDPRRVVASAVFGTSLVLLYGASTLYHAIPQPRAKGVLQRLDHAAIFLLIAGSYTPFALVSLRGPVGWSLLVGIWALAGLGVALVAAPPRGRLRHLRLVLCLGMGWLAVAVLQPLLAALHATGLTLLVLGGLAYTLGVVFYAWRRIPYHHALWHVLVMVGSGCHFACVLVYVIEG